MYNYAFYAYLFYRGLQATSSIENALGFVKSISWVFSSLKKITRPPADEHPDIGWILVFIEGESLQSRM
jgi:hypothetical protein